MNELIHPLDEHNRTLLDHVHPADWRNPEPHGMYDLVVLGAGTAGLVTAAGAAGLGAKVALVERHLMGGDCLNTGCVPSKALLHAAREAFEARRHGDLIDPKQTFKRAMESLRRKRADIAVHDSARRFTDLGVDVFIGDARFTDARTVTVGNAPLRFRKACIATGARAAAPSIPGLENVPYLTNETLFNLTELPERLTVVGAGPIGAEMAQAFARLGSHVTLIDSGAQILGREEPDAANLVEKRLRAEGVTVHLNARIVSVTGSESGKRLTLRQGTLETKIESDQILIAAGRAPNVESLGLEAAGIAFGQQGVMVDDRLRTTNTKVYACGDVASAFKFTHAADFQARIVIQNALFFGRKKTSALIIPWVTYTDPEVAHVGLYRHEAKTKGVAVKAFRLGFDKVDRSLLEEQTDGFAEVLVANGTDRIVGATIVHPHAGEMVSEITLAMAKEIGLGSLAGVIHPYPTQAEILRKLGDLYNKERLTPLARKILRLALKLGR
jgi:pyruvate/2-oxoglutarate dehydrogenase complex dihydrolipoamide dehydrogenase (E3) component